MRWTVSVARKDGQEGELGKWELIGFARGTQMGLRNPIATCSGSGFEQGDCWVAVPGR